MSFYVKKLYDNELGYRKGIPNKAGKFLLVSKKRADFFPPHKTDEIDPSMSLGIIIDEMKHLVHAEYTHDNDPESGHRGNDRRINEAYAGVDWGGGSPQSIAYLRIGGCYKTT